jgi:hypothetical protein
LLREQGLHAEEIGIVLAASTAIRVLTGPAIGHMPLIVSLDTHRSRADVRSRRP